jgi:hypothetical protein
MNSKGGRYIPMGYSAADIASIRPMFQDYLVCGPVNETVDFFAVNIYEWVLSPLDPLLSHNTDVRVYSAETHRSTLQDTLND